MDDKKKEAILFIAHQLRAMAKGMEMLAAGLVAKTLENLAEQLEQIAND